MSTDPSNQSYLIHFASLDSSAHSTTQKEVSSMFAEVNSHPALHFPAAHRCNLVAVALTPVDLDLVAGDTLPALVDVDIESSEVVAAVSAHWLGKNPSMQRHSGTLTCSVLHSSRQT